MVITTGLSFPQTKLVSWNIHRCFGTDGHYRPDRIAEVLRSLNADVVALQEVDSSLRNEDGEDQLQYIAREVGMQAIMGPTLKFDYGAYGNAVLTRHKILSAVEIDLSYRRVEPRGALAVDIDLTADGATNPRRLRLVNTHLGLKYWERAFQIDRILSDFSWDANFPSVLTGDFNEWFPLTLNGVRLQRAFRHSTARLPTFPAGWPRFALDRIFATGDLQSFTYEVPRQALTRVASDHLPILGNLAF